MKRHTSGILFTTIQKKTVPVDIQHTKPMINSMHVDLKFDIINENLDPDCSNF